MNPRDLVCIYTLTDPVKAEILRNALRTESIRCFLNGEESAAATSMAAFPIDVMVPAADADRAQKLIASHERG